MYGLLALKAGSSLLIVGNAASRHRRSAASRVEGSSLTKVRIFLLHGSARMLRRSLLGESQDEWDGLPAVDCRVMAACAKCC